MIQGDAETDLADYPIAGLRLRGAQPDVAGDARAEADAASSCCGSAAGRSSRCRTLRIGAAARRCCSAAGCRSARLLHYNWYDTPNIHLCSIRDFVTLAGEMGVTIERGLFLDDRSVPRRLGRSLRLANLLGEQAIFLLKS